MSFYDWCVARYLGSKRTSFGHLGYDDTTRFGDFAYDIPRDVDFPRMATNKDVIANYLQKQEACYKAMQTFWELAFMYEREMQHA
ncbi:MAG: YozE family protein [Desulfosporosinus sp.]|nr:YozE family protein [Desulfosporosinus sp.]